MRSPRAAATTSARQSDRSSSGTSGPQSERGCKSQNCRFDFRNGRLRVLAGKSRHAEWLPLTQEVGDAIIAYLQRARPNVRTARLFVTEFSPLRPVTRITVKGIVNRTLDRAGIESPHGGAHVLRHSAATAMLRHGVSLTGVGAVLRPPPGALPDADEISQSITTALGRNYTLQFALMDESNSVLDQFQVTFGAFSDTINGTDPLLEGAYEVFSFPITGTGIAKSLDFQGTNTSAAWNLDDVSLDVPMPAGNR